MRWWLLLSDLVPDERGEIVVFNDAQAPLHIAVDGTVVASGLADPHITAAGIDVTGMHFSMFDSGLTRLSRSRGQSDRRLGAGRCPSPAADAPVGGRPFRMSRRAPAFPGRPHP